MMPNLTGQMPRGETINTRVHMADKHESAMLMTWRACDLERSVPGGGHNSEGKEEAGTCLASVGARTVAGTIRRLVEEERGLWMAVQTSEECRVIETGTIKCLLCAGTSWTLCTISHELRATQLKEAKPHKGSHPALMLAP